MVLGCLKHLQLDSIYEIDVGLLVVETANEFFRLYVEILINYLAKGLRLVEEIWVDFLLKISAAEVRCAWIKIYSAV